VRPVEDTEATPEHAHVQHEEMSGTAKAAVVVGIIGAISACAALAHWYFTKSRRQVRTPDSSYNKFALFVIITIVANNCESLPPSELFSVPCCHCWSTALLTGYSIVYSATASVPRKD
jgi:hypothetical protein